MIVYQIIWKYNKSVIRHWYNNSWSNCKIGIGIILSAIIMHTGICQEGHFISCEEIDNWYAIDNWYPIIISNQVFWKITNN